MLEYEEENDIFSWEIFKSLKYTLYNYNQTNCHHNDAGGNFQLLKTLALLNLVYHSISCQHYGLKCLRDWFREELDNETRSLLHYLPV